MCIRDRLFAFVPPPSFFNGYLTFFITLGLIGVLTAIVGDMAAIFGCLVGLKDTVTAITFVALGTSMPDLFASREVCRPTDWFNIYLYSP